MAPDENAYQSRLMRTVRQHIKLGMPELAYFHSVPNSTKTSKSIAVRMVKEGVTPGVHDLHWDLCRGGYTGLTIEMKVDGKNLRVEQKAFAKFYVSQGMLTLRCMTDEDAWAAIQWYYHLPPTPPSLKVLPPQFVQGMAAPTEHMFQAPAARLAANAKRRRTLAAKAAGSAKNQDATQAAPSAGRTVKYPAKG